MYQKTRTWEVAPALPLQLAIKLFSAQLQQIDSNGDTLLHLACRGGKPERHREPWDDGPDDDESDDDSFFVIKTYDNWDMYNHEQIHCLLSVNPEAAKVKNGNGELPIHIAIKARKCWSNIIHKILLAYPKAIAKTDGDGNTCLHLAALVRSPLLVDYSDYFDPEEHLT